MAGRITPFGKYFLLDRINVGGMAEVYKAKTVGVEGFEKIVAIKRILPSVAEDEEFIKMFVDEAKITSQLSHANLCQTFDLGKIDDTFYIAMEYVPGRDLRAVFERMNRRGERMPLMLASYVMARVCDGLDYAHRKHDPSGRDLHIVHRDVSPQNIIVSYEGEVKLIDFGIAKAANKITKTQAGILKGKFGYMSPEQVRGLALDGRSDIFAAGVVMYELCTGERLFTGASDFSVLEKVQQAKVPPPSQVDPAIPLRLERIILKALAREPEDRYQQAADFAHDLTRFLMETHSRAVTREEVAAFMKGTFPEDREEISRPVRRPPPRISDPPAKKASQPPTIPEEERASPPPLPQSLTEDLEEKSPIPGQSDPDRTQVSAAPDGPPAEARAEIIVKSRLPPLPDLGPLPMPQPDSGAGDLPTRPMSMDELARAERDFIEREKKAREAQAGQPARKLGSGENTPTPEGAPSNEALAASAALEKPAGKPEKKAPSRPPPPLPATLLEGVPAAEKPPPGGAGSAGDARSIGGEPPRRSRPPPPGRNGARSTSKPRPRPPPPQIRDEEPAVPAEPAVEIPLE
ncbi:MAG TPA: serine/threonine-protein kinase, partial [Myxococcales bacterium]|nr:serine/threonine-protein kinase [Myxococcales bacterium]